MASTQAVEADRDLDRQFTDLYVEYHLPVRRFVFARLRVISDEDASDIVGEVFFNVYRKLPEYRDVGIPIVHWVFKIARNTMINWTRRPKVNRYDIEVHDRPDPSAERDLADIVSDDFLATVLAELSERDALVLKLRYVDGLELASIADVLAGLGYDVTPATMKKVHQRVLARVKRGLEGNPPKKTGRPAARVRAAG